MWKSDILCDEMGTSCTQTFSWRFIKYDLLWKKIECSTHKCVKDSINKCTDISNEIDSLSSIQFEIKETSKGKKHVNNSND